MRQKNRREENQPVGKAKPASSPFSLINFLFIFSNRSLEGHEQSLERMIDSTYQISIIFMPGSIQLITHFRVCRWHSAACRSSR